MKVLEAQRPARRHSLTVLLQIINRWKKLVIGVTLLAAIISIVVAKTLPNEYRSTAIFLPLNFETVDPVRIVSGERLDVISTNEDIDRYITIGESNLLADHIIKKHNLYKHYDIDTAQTDINKQQVLEEFMGAYTIEQSPRDVIEVSFIDKDKEFASRVANDIVSYIDTLSQKLTRENHQKAVALHKSNFDYISKEYKALRDSVYINRKEYGVFNMDRESRYLAERLVNTETDLRQAKAELAALSKSYNASNPTIINLKAKISGLESALEGLTKKQNGNVINLESYLAGADIMADLQLQLTDLTQRYNNSKTSYDNAKMALSGNVSTIYTIQKAVPATKKAKPVRWLIVVSSTLLTFFILVFLVAIFELYRREIGFANA